MGLEYLESYDVADQSASDIIGKTKDFLVSTATDFVATTYNSTLGLLPNVDDVQTKDWLEKIDQDSLSFYEENQNLVETASFLSGIVLPGVVSIKALDAARKGALALGYAKDATKVSKAWQLAKTTTNTFSGAKKKLLTQEIEKVFAEAGSGAPMFAKLKRQLWADAMANWTLDAAAAEVGMVLTMNAHPYMEDYMGDSYGDTASSFAKGVMFGAALSPLAIPARLREVRQITGALETRAITDVYSELLPYGEKIGEPALFRPNAQRYQIAQENLRRLTELNNRDYNGLTKMYIKNEILNVSEESADAVKKVAPFLNEKDSPELATFVKNFLLDPSNAGVDNIRPVNLKGNAKVTSKVIEKDDFLTELKEADKKVVAFMRFDDTGKPTFYAKEGAQNAGRAVDIPNLDLKAFEIKYIAPDNDWAIEATTGAGAASLTDAKFLATLKKIDSLKPAEFEKIAAAPDDLPLLNAVLARYAKGENLPPIRITRDYPTYSEQVQYIQSRPGVKANHLTEGLRLSEDRNLVFASQNLSENASKALSGWVHGHGFGSVRAGIKNLRDAFTTFLHGTAGDKYDIANEIWKAGQKFRNELAKIADSEGYIYLYRGLQREPFSSAAVESFTFRRDVALRFGEDKLFRIPVKNVIGTLGSGPLGEAEVLVASAVHSKVSDIPLGDVTRVTVATSGETATRSAADIADFLAAQTERAVRSMMSYGRFSFDEIASRLGMKADAVQAVALGGSLSDIQGWRRYTDATKIHTEYLNSKYRMHGIYGNANKNLVLEGIKNLDARTAHSMHLEFADDVVLTSDSVLAKQAHELYNSEEMKNYLMLLRDKLSLFNNSVVGSHKWQSADNALRDIAFSEGKPVGALVTYLGRQVTIATDTIIKSLLEPFASTFVSMRGKDSAIAEFSNVRNVLMGMKGWRQMFIDPDQGWAFFVNQVLPDNFDFSNITELKQFAYRTKNTGEIFYVKQPEVISALKASQTPSAELFKLHNTIRRIQGKAPIKDLGFYLPPTPLVNKFHSYVIDPKGLKQTEVIVANSAEELQNLENVYRQEIISQNPWLEIVRPSDKEAYNLINNYLDGGSPYVTFADISLRHGGASKLAMVPGDTRAIQETLEGFEYQIIASLRKFNENYLYDITSTLSRLSDYNQGAFKNQSLWASVTRKADKDAARHIRNILLGRKSTDLTTGWKVTEDLFDRAVNYTGMKINKLTESMSFNNEAIASQNFQKLSDEFQRLGIENPWRSFQEYFQSLNSDSSTFSKRLVNTGNALMATLQLRLLDAGFIIANLVSLPILGSSSLWENVDAVKVAGGGKLRMFTKTLSDGVAFMFTPEGKMMNALWTEKGLVNQAVRQYVEATATINAAPVSKQFTEKAIQATNNLLDSDAIKLLTKPADFTENLTRQIMMNIGYTSAKKAYPGIDNLGATIYATNFTDRAIGNYFAAQRPMFFQGTLGATIGLYQTYMLTFAQSVFRGLESANYGKLAALAAAQAGIFGTSSLPGYQVLSELIGKHYSNDNYDLTTGTYRALGEEGAELVLYGLPSSLFDMALHVRGDVTPRVPSLSNVAIVNTVGNTITALTQGISQITNAPDATGKLQAFGEALSLQTVSRPLARMSEIAVGNSITREGRTVSAPEDVWTFNGVAARILALRPLEEQKLRDTIHLDKYYGAADYEARQKVIRRLRIGIRDGNLTDKEISDAAADYLAKGGSAKGWTAAINEVFVTTPAGARIDLLRKLEADSPLRLMIEDNF